MRSALLVCLCVLCAAVAMHAHSERMQRELMVRDLRQELARVAYDLDATRAEIDRCGETLRAAQARLALVVAERDATHARAASLATERDAARAATLALGERLTEERDEARSKATTLTAQLEAAVVTRQTADGHVQRLEAHLQRELDRHRDIETLIAQTGEALRVERERHNAEIRAARRFMPEGVRQALIALNECLRADGQTGLRFMRATSIEDAVLRDVQLLDHDPRTLISKVYLAEQLTFHLDRKGGSVTLLFKGGCCSSPEGRREFPADGERLLLPAVDGPLWEKRLPYLMRATGDYPTPTLAIEKPVMRSALRMTWAGRVNQLLRLAKTGTRYRLETFRDLREGRFEDALLLGYDGRRLSTSVEATAMSVHVDRRQSAVELLVDGGILRNAGGEATIPASGYRILLTGVTPAQATDVMQGMVVGN